MSKEAMKLALEALELNNDEWKSLADFGDSGYWKAEDRDHYQQTNKAIAALREALAQDVPEVGFGNMALDKMAENARELGLDYEPAQRTWVGLTDEEMIDLQDRCGISIHQSDFQTIEAKLKEKNNG